MKKIEFFLLMLILLGAFNIRLYQFHRPVADWHSWRQVDTSAVSRNFLKYGFDVLHPKFDDFSKGVSLLDNPQGYRFVEFPIYNVLQAGLFKLFGNFTLEQWGRLVTIFSQLLAMVFLYAIVKKYLNVRAGLIATSFLAFVPYNIYFGRVILPDSSMVMASLGGIYFFDRWLEIKSKIKNKQSLSLRDQKSKVQFKIQNYIFFVLSIVFTTSAFLFKPFALFFTLPLLYLAFRAFGIVFLRKKELWLFLVVTLTPLILWRLWMQQYPEGIPQSGWLFNQYGIRFKGAFFHWLFAERIGQLILGYFGLPFVIIGMLLKNKKEGLLWYAFLASSFLYMTVIAYGNVHHDYYQILIMPTLAIFFASGANFVFEKAGELFNRYTSYVIVIACVLFMLAFGWYKIRDYYNLQHVEVLMAGEAVDRLAPKEAKVIAPYGGDTTLLYYTKRRGWPVWDRPIQEFLKAGAQYLVFTEPKEDELNFKKYFPVVDALENEYVIFDLTKPLPLAEEILKPKKSKK